MRASISEIARQLGVSMRHARRLRKAGDARLVPVDGAWASQWRKKHQAEALQAQTGPILEAVWRLNVLLDREQPPWAPAARAEIVKVERAAKALLALAPTE